MTRKTGTARAHGSATGQTPAEARADQERSSRMILYTCQWEKRSSGWHPCGVAARALDEAGYSYEIKVVRGQLSMPWTWLSRRRDRAEVRSLSGQDGVPVLVGDDGIRDRRLLADRALGEGAAGPTQRRATSARFDIAGHAAVRRRWPAAGRRRNGLAAAAHGPERAFR